MTPQELLQHSDTGEPWPQGGGAAFAALPSACRCALAVRAGRIARGEMPRGYKVGFTNRTIWPRCNVYAPIWGSMCDTTDIVAGDIVTTGTWTDAWPVRPGETLTARFDSALPPLEVAFG